MAVTASAIARTVGEVKKQAKKRKFDQSVDLAINLKEVDMNKPENRIDEELVLPHGRGKDLKVAVIADGELAHQAKKITDGVIVKEELEEMAKNKKDAKKIVNKYDFFIAQTDLMTAVGRFLGPILGPRGKMPKPIPPNIQIAPIVERLKKTIKIKTKEKPVINVPVGTESMDDERITENIEAVLSLVTRKLVRGTSNIKSVYIKTTMGPSIKLEA